MFLETADIETSTDDYASRFDSTAGRWMLALQEAIVVRWLSVGKSLSVLDVGGGHAQLAKPLTEAGHKVTVIGSDDSCRNRLRPEVDDGRIQFVAGDLINLPFADSEFDVVISFRFLPHCGKWERLIQEMCRVARTEVIVDFPSLRSINVISKLFFGLKKQVEGNTRPFRVFRHGELREAFGQSGYALARQKPQFFLPLAFHRLVNSPAFSGGLERAFASFGLTSLFGSPVIGSFRPSAPSPQSGKLAPAGPVADE